MKRAIFMKLLYFATGLATGLQLYRLMMWGVWGRPTRTIEYVGVLGSGVFILMAAFGPTRKRPTHLAALVAAALLWMVYGQSVLELFSPPAPWPEEWSVRLAMFGPLSLLTLSTLCALFWVSRSAKAKDA
jgi:hypothetical protein